MAEDYVRPPLVPREPASRALATWRFRLVATVLLVVVALTVFVLFLKFSNVTEEDPGFGIGLKAPVTAPAAG